MMLPTILLAALTALPALVDRAVPVISAQDESTAYRTTLFIDNGNDHASTCRFTSPGEETVDTTERYTTKVFPHFLRHLTAPAAVRAKCPDDVDLYIRIQTSRNRGRTWDRGRIFVPMAPVTSRRHQMRITSDLVVGESTGKPADVRMVIRRGAVVKTDETVRFEGAGLTLMTFGDGEPLEPDLTLELEVIAGEGRLAVGEAIRDPRVRDVIEARERMAMLPKIAPGNMQAAKMLGIAPFKAAPFQDPATGLIYMRERWYDPRTGTFLGPDPMAYRDSPNPYTYCGGDPVNCTDPTGTYGVEFHYYVLYYLARAAGLGAGVASDVAWSSQFVDNTPQSSPVANAITGNEEVVRLLHFVAPPGDLVQRNNPYVRQLVLEAAASGNPIRFGITLHSFADSYSHEGFVAATDARNLRTGPASKLAAGMSAVGVMSGVPSSWPPSLPGHAGEDHLGHFNDEPFTNVNKAIEASREIFWHMQRFALNYYGRPVPSQRFHDIEPRLRVLFAVTDPESMRIGRWRAEIQRMFEDTQYRKTDVFGVRRHFNTLLRDQQRRAGQIAK